VKFDRAQISIKFQRKLNSTTSCQKQLPRRRCQ